MDIFALIGTTASGKTSYSIELANKHDAYILSLDSLSIYKEIDIVSAKPTLLERKNIKHFGIDIILPSQDFNVNMFFDEYKRAYEEALKNNKNLLIVGGTGFYLKSMIEGISPKPTISSSTKIEVAKNLENLENAYKTILDTDKNYALKISSNDKYRIEKWFEIYKESGVSVTEYFKNNPKIPIIKENIIIYNIDIPRDILKEKIKKRTKQMLKNGLLDEIKYLENKYTRAPKCFRSIGIKECFEYFDGLYSIEKLEEKIVTNTNKLAKRQRTFNKTQFQSVREIKGKIQ
ncbi:MAG: tRNA dimethylallyltransferase (EC [uncultured Campylobacterales bacterium]|uniref:tRNA dimethylallyltransferase n=1 Tax=uncultured Campylobacterales bacterium TaxID=352960 RepID=A0A6S6SFU6_9BACT|nr:MAG: tRNA dimethylallyltransferase (EC [uncultured Campylobacterales bacterium]